MRDGLPTKPVWVGTSFLGSHNFLNKGSLMYLTPSADWSGSGERGIDPRDEQMLRRLYAKHKENLDQDEKWYQVSVRGNKKGINQLIDIPRKFAVGIDDKGVYWEPRGKGAGALQKIKQYLKMDEDVVKATEMEDGSKLTYLPYLNEYHLENPQGERFAYTLNDDQKTHYMYKEPGNDRVWEARSPGWFGTRFAQGTYVPELAEELSLPLEECISYKYKTLKNMPKFKLKRGPDGDLQLRSSKATYGLKDGKLVKLAHCLVRKIRYGK